MNTMLLYFLYTLYIVCVYIYMYICIIIYIILYYRYMIFYVFILYIYTYMYAYIYIIIYIFNIFSMKLEDPHMCFYNPPFLSMAHMGMAPEYQPDDAGFSAT